jgi:DNA-binding response OmpR family regulator
MTKILIVEDDPILATTVSDALEFEHYMVETVDDGSKALEFLRAYSYDLLIFDFNLPGMNGFDLCRTFRMEGGEQPVLMLTAKSSIPDKTDGYEAGADDYLTKPFHIKELLLRVKALLKRVHERSSEILQAGDLTLDPSAFKLAKNGKEIKLTPIEFALLEFLMRHQGKVFSAESLINSVWPSTSERLPETVRTCVKKLRDKVDTKGSPSIIVNVPGLGYKIDAQ